MWYALFLFLYVFGFLLVYDTFFNVFYLYFDKKLPNNTGGSTNVIDSAVKGDVVGNEQSKNCDLVF